MKTTVTDALYAGCEAVVKIAWLNGLWLLFTLLGGILFGWAPSTAAMCAVIRKWLMGQKDVPVFVLFLDTYKKEFLKVNAIGLAFFALLLILSANYYYFSASADWLSFTVTSCTLLAGLLYTVALMYVFPLYVHYELPLRQYIPQALLFGAMRPLTTGCMLIGCGFVLYLLYTLPGLIPFYGPSLFGLVSMFFAFRGFQKTEAQHRHQAG
ncbi:MULTISPECIES: YesL family protein [Bacillus]|uniref:YesL family protein n=1 Tax=Bacillus TaxID=1386 RepID=UPI001D0E83E3|nr:YesL family protein [Bacillus halotolerans]MCC2529314.1 YesL family protein [Bacillus halotolerans]MDP4526412.1 YesL family protein [Bacillus halotolerans]